MVALPTPIEEYYHIPRLLEEILKRLAEQEVDLDNVSRSDIAGVDEIHVRGAEVSLELASEAGLYGSSILDVGCGLGGPSRMLADEFNCRVTAIDLSHEYIRTAKGLSVLVGLHGKIDYLQSDALHLPFKNKSFAVVWTQHVQMNIEDKTRYYAEISRVLKDQGRFIYYDILRKGRANLTYPLPWANDPSMNFLANSAEMRSILTGMGFIETLRKDQTRQGAQFLNDLLEKLKKNGPSKLDLNVLMGPKTKEKLINLLMGLDEEKIILQSGIFEKGV